jgi:hypothetical protein
MSPDVAKVLLSKVPSELLRIVRSLGYRATTTRSSMKYLLLVLPLLSGCPTPVCSTLAARCNGPRAELCDSRGQWQLVADCAEAGAVCESVGEEVACAPEER